MTRSRTYALLILLLLTVFLRVEITRLTEVDQPLRADAADYVFYGANLVEFGIYSRDRRGLSEGLTPTADSFRPAGYPLFLTPFIALLGLDTGVIAVKWAQTALSVLVVALIFLLAMQCLPWWLAYLVALLTSVSPHLININVYWLTESLFTFLLAASLFLFARYTQAGARPVLLVLTGLVFGYCVLTRATISLFLLPMLMLLYFHHRDKFSRNGVVLLVFALLIPLAWNLGYAPNTDQGGSDLLRNTIHHGIYPGFMFRDQPQSFGYPYRFDPRSAEIAASWPSLADELLRRFVEEPARHLRWFLVDKPKAFLSWDMVQGAGGSFIYPIVYSPYYSMPHFTWSHVAAGYLHTPLVVLALIGSLLVWCATWRRWLPARDLLVPQVSSLLLLYFIAIHIVVPPFPRYAIPLRPFCYLLAIWCIWVGLQRLFPRLVAKEV